MPARCRSCGETVRRLPHVCRLTTPDVDGTSPSGILSSTSAILPKGPRERPRAPRGCAVVQETTFQRSVVTKARELGWRVNHVPRSSVGHGKDAGFRTTTTEPGWPDLTLWRPPALMFIECKGHRGALEDDQWVTLDELLRCGLDAYVAWPWEFDLVAQLLGDQLLV